MTQQDIEELEYLCKVHGVYEVAKVLKNIAVTSSDEYHHNGNHDAIIHKDAITLTNACNIMAMSHPLRINDVT